MSPFLHRLRSKSSFHKSSSSSSSGSLSSRSSGIDQSQETKLFRTHRNVTNPISILVETEVITECYRCGPGRGHAHGEKCYDDNVIIIDRPSRDMSSTFTGRQNVAAVKSPLRNAASHSYLYGTAEAKRQQRRVDPTLQDEFQKLSASRAKIESEVKEHTEFLRLLQGRREQVAAEGQRLQQAELRDRMQPEFRSHGHLLPGQQEPVKKPMRQ